MSVQPWYDNGDHCDRTTVPASPGTMRYDVAKSQAALAYQAVRRSGTKGSSDPSSGRTVPTISLRLVRGTIGGADDSSGSKHTSSASEARSCPNVSRGEAAMPHMTAIGRIGGSANRATVTAMNLLASILRYFRGAPEPIGPPTRPFRCGTPWVRAGAEIIEVKSREEALEALEKARRS